MNLFRSRCTVLCLCLIAGKGTTLPTTLSAGYVMMENGWMNGVITMFHVLI